MDIISFSVIFFSINCTVVRFLRTWKALFSIVFVFRSSFAGDLIFPSFSLWFYYFRTICLSMDFESLLYTRLSCTFQLENPCPSAPNISLLLVLCQFCPCHFCCLSWSLVSQMLNFVFLSYILCRFHPPILWEVCFSPYNTFVKNFGTYIFVFRHYFSQTSCFYFVDALSSVRILIKLFEL